MNPLFSQLLAGSNNQRGTGQSVALPGQEALTQDMTGLLGFLGQAQPKSGAIGLPQQQQEMMDIVLPPKQGVDGYGLPNENIPGLPPLPGMGGAPQPVAPQGGYESMPMVGGVQQQQMSATGQPMPMQPPTWGELLNPFGGNRDNPNSLVRMGEGYNSGGLIGALGYLLTDMSKQGGGQ